MTKATREEIFAAKTLAQLEALEKKYNYAFGWAYRVHVARAAKTNIDKITGHKN